MKKPKAKAKKSEPVFSVPVPQPPVSAMFSVDGLMLTVIEGKKVYYKILSWKELYKLGKTGKKMTPPEMVKKMTDKLDDMMADRAKSDAERQKALDELKRKYGSSPVRVSPLPPVMPVPPYRRAPGPVSAGPVIGETPLAPDPMANMFKDLPPTSPPSVAGN